MICYDPLFATMKRLGISSYRLEKLGFSRSTYYAMKRNQSVSTHTIDQLCRLLHCSVSEIMEYREE